MSTLTPQCGDDEHDAAALDITEALEFILNTVQKVRGFEKLSIRHALDRVLAEDIISPLNVPAYPNSAMDGYALSAADLPPTGERTLKIIGTAWAGRPFSGAINSGDCARIMTGAKIPEGADTVIMQEQVTVQGEKVKIGAGHKKAQHVRKTGEDLSQGQTVLTAGKTIGPAELGLLASLGISEIKVWRRPRIAFFSPGDELRPVGEILAEGEIYDSNRYTLYGMLKRLGVEFIDMGAIADERDTLRRAFQEAVTVSDVIITSGGVSVGEADFVKEILQELGEVKFWKIAMKPGKPLAFGKIDHAFFFGLPGNPVSAMVTFYQLVQPALRQMMGQTINPPLRFRVRCQTKLRKKPGRIEFQRGILRQEDQQWVVYSTGGQGSGILSSMSTANCFIILPRTSSGVEVGEEVEIEPFHDIL